MTRLSLPVDVPCAVCLEPIKEWLDGWECDWTGPQGNALAQPCGHRLHEIMLEWEIALRRKVE